VVSSLVVLVTVVSLIRGVLGGNVVSLMMRFLVVGCLMVV